MNPTEPRCDVAVVGAGPAGAACALALRDSGLSVVVLEKDTFPRDKICGDAIPGPVFRVMEQLSPVWGQALRDFSPETRVRSARFFGPNGRLGGHLHWVMYSYNSKRLDFDAFLADLLRRELPESLHEHKRLERIERQPDGMFRCYFRDGSTLLARSVVGCDGAYSVVARQLGDVDLQERHSCIAVRAYYQGISGLQPEVNEVHLLRGLLPGYLWIFPLANGVANVGYGRLRNARRKESLPPPRVVLEQLPQYAPELAARFSSARLLDGVKGFSLPLALRRWPRSGAGYLLCGDAAALVDPLQGHGIDTAMISGVLAARQLQRCFEAGRFDGAFMRQYDRAVTAKLGFELSRNALIMRTLGTFPWLLELSGLVGRYERQLNWLVRKLHL